METVCLHCLIPYFPDIVIKKYQFSQSIIILQKYWNSLKHKTAKKSFQQGTVLPQLMWYLDVCILFVYIHLTELDCLCAKLSSHSEIPSPWMTSFCQWNPLTVRACFSFKPVISLQPLLTYSLHHARMQAISCRTALFLKRQGTGCGTVGSLCGGSYTAHGKTWRWLQPTLGKPSMKSDRENEEEEEYSLLPKHHQHQLSSSPKRLFI